MNQFAQARQIIEEELGQPVDSIFLKFSAQLVATASIRWKRSGHQSPEAKKGLRFVDELDYVTTAENAECITESVQNKPLKGVMFVPAIIEE